MHTKNYTINTLCIRSANVNTATSSGRWCKTMHSHSIPYKWFSFYRKIRNEKSFQPSSLLLDLISFRAFRDSASAPKLQINPDLTFLDSLFWHKLRLSCTDLAQKLWKLPIYPKNVDWFVIKFGQKLKESGPDQSTIWSHLCLLSIKEIKWNSETRHQNWLLNLWKIL